MINHIQPETKKLLEKIIKELCAHARTLKTEVTERDRYVISQINEVIQDKIYIYKLK